MNSLRVSILITIVSINTAYGAEDMVSAGFPFAINGSQFVKDGKDVFLNIICYQPLEPSQKIDGEIRVDRLQDDIRRWHAYQGGEDPVVLRVYPQPTQEYPMRLPKSFYDGVRELGFWIIRDVYFDSLDINKGKEKVDAVITEVNDANALDLIFAWEIGDEFEAPWDGSIAEIRRFIEEMCAHI